SPASRPPGAPRPLALPVAHAQETGLRAVSGAVQLCDEEGHVVGYFRPACGVQRYPEPPTLPPEELQRRLAARDGRKISEILADLESRS
ncbi:MAG: hypothetical protein EBS90_13735, partial [Betaproteobacteria bacterium]|nr:hypothetical protein [Betaproteobacteria bacterium]